MPFCTSMFVTLGPLTNLLPESCGDQGLRPVSPHLTSEYLPVSVWFQVTGLIGSAWLAPSLCSSATRLRESIAMNSNSNFEPLLLNVNQVAELLGCHRNTIWNRVRSGDMPQPVKFGGKTVWRRSEIEKFAEMLCP